MFLTAMRGFRYFFADPPLASDDLRINGLGYHEAMPPTVVHRPGGTDDWLLMLFHHPVTLSTRRGTGRCAPGTLVVWEPRQRHRYGDRSRRWEHSWIHCAGAAMPRLAARLPRDEALVLDDESPFTDCILRLHRELRGPWPPDAAIVRNHLDSALRDIARRLVGKPRAAASPVALLAAKDHIERRFHEDLRLDQLAAGCRLSVSRFCQLFKQHFGHSAIDYCIRLRMHRAAFLLRDPELPVGEIARQVGYDDPAWFSRLFRRHHGCSPRAWRRRLTAATSGSGS